MKKEIQIQLDIDEINTIIEALGQLPFMKVYKIIEKIHIQSNNQLSENANNNKQQLKN